MGTFDKWLKKNLASATETGYGAATSMELKPGVFTVNEPAGTASEKKRRQRLQLRGTIATKGVRSTRGSTKSWLPPLKAAHHKAKELT